MSATTVRKQRWVRTTVQASVAVYLLDQGGMLPAISNVHGVTLRSSAGEGTVVEMRLGDRPTQGPQHLPAAGR